jgi:hypothetical protein
VIWRRQKSKGEFMMKVLAAAIMAVILTSTAASAGFGKGSLNGTYVFSLRGFDLNDNTHTGEVAVLGVVSFNGAGKFKGTLNLTSADSGGDQAACTTAVSGTAGSYTVASDGTGTLTLVLSSPSSGTLNFNLVVQTPGGATAFLLESDTSLSAVSVCGESINTMVLTGGVQSEK